MTHKRMGAVEARNYLAYLLRLWRERSGESSRWRASLQDPHSGERVGFANLDELFGYLRRETGDLPETDGGELGNEGRNG